MCWGKHHWSSGCGKRRSDSINCEDGGVRGSLWRSVGRVHKKQKFLHMSDAPNSSCMLQKIFFKVDSVWQWPQVQYACQKKQAKFSLWIAAWHLHILKMKSGLALIKRCSKCLTQDKHLKWPKPSFYCILTDYILIDQWSTTSAGNLRKWQLVE